MVAFITARLLSVHWTAVRRSLGLLLLIPALLLLAAPAASQDGDEPPHEAAPPREAATLDLTISPRPNLAADLGQATTVPVVIANHGNIAALGVVAAVESAALLEVTPLAVGDIAPGGSAAVELPVTVVGRSAFPLPFAVRATATNVDHAAVATAEQSFAPPNAGDYLTAPGRINVLLDRRFARYDAGRRAGEPLLWIELTDRRIDNRVVSVRLERLLHGRAPDDLALSVLYYPDEQSAPQPLATSYDLATARLSLVLPGPGRYLVEWTRPEPADAQAAPLAAAAAEPELPGGWTPTYHAPLVSEFTGSVTLSYPMLTPLGAAGLQPTLGLAYSSANGNGMIGRLQADETGFGWHNMALIDVTQALDACQDNVCEKLGGSIDDNPDTYDPYNQYTLSFNGVGYELIHANGKAANGQPGRYYAQGHAGLYVELCKSPLSDYCKRLSDVDGLTYTQSNVVWRISGPDGTTYRLGGTAESEQGLMRPADAPGVDNKALRWRVDTIVDRFDNVMRYRYVEDTYAGWVHPEYFHAPASYLREITYDAYTVTFDHVSLPYGAYREQGYGYAVSYQTRYLSLVTIKTGAQQIRHYALGYDYQRYGVDNDTDHPPQEAPLAAPLGYQSPWCAAYQHVLDFKNGGNPDDNVAYVPDKLPVLLNIVEGGSNGATRSTASDADFRYIFLPTGQYDHAQAGPHVRYCFPYLLTVESLYGPADAATPTTRAAWRDATSANPTLQNYGGNNGASVVGRYVNVVESETTYSGFAADAPTQNAYFRYTTPNMEGDDDTFQGFNIVDRCQDAACAGGGWTRKETLTFLTLPYPATNAALTGRLSRRDVVASGGALAARTDNTWAMLDADGTNGVDPARAAVLTQTIQRDYRGEEIATRTQFVYDAYGNQMQVQEFGQQLSGNTPKRTLERLVTPNLDVSEDLWFVNLPWRETLWDGPVNGGATNILRRTNYRYDGAACNQSGNPPPLGRLTAEDHYLPGSSNQCAAGNWLTTSYAYHATRQWQVTGSIDPAGRARTYTWTNATQLGSVSFAVGGVNHTTAYIYNPVFRWQVSQVTQPNGAKMGYVYDVHGRLDQVKPPDAGTGDVGAAAIDYTYGDTANPFYVEEKNLAISSANSPTTRTFYDALGRPLQARRWNVSSDFSKAITDTYYDTLGRVTCETPLMSDGGPADTFNAALRCLDQARITYAYDVLGEATTTTALDGATTTTAVLGRARQVTNGNGHMTRYEYDDLGRLTKAQEPTGGLTMTYTYDLAGNLLKATDSDGLITTMTYDKLGRKLTMSDPDMGVWSYAYDGSGNLTRQTDANNQRLCFYYDDANRLTHKTRNGSGTTACPDTAGGTVLATYTYGTTGTSKGLLLNVSGSGAGEYSDIFQYDLRGRVTQQTRTYPATASTYIMATTYDSADRPLTVGYYPSGDVITYGYDREFAQSLSSTGAGALVSDLNYNPRGQVVKIDRAGGGLVDTEYSYHNQTSSFRLSEIRHGGNAAGDQLPDFVYSLYDDLGNIRQISTRQAGATTETVNYTYDAIGRLSTAAGTGAGSYDYLYTYKTNGNIQTRVNRSPNPDHVRTYSYVAASDHAVTGISGQLTASFGYDANGNMTSRTVAGVSYTQTFDVENRLISVLTGGQTTTFHYDADGNRIMTVQPDGTKIYTPFPDYEESVSAGGAKTERVTYRLAGQTVAVRVRTAPNQSGVVYYTYTDHLGSVSIWSYTGGTPVAGSLARYEPFGGYHTRPANAVNPEISDRGFTGHRSNNTGVYPTQNLNLIYMNARYYMPEIGRFISADTIVPSPENPQSYNRYSYTNNNPVNYTDPSGHCINNYEVGSEDMDTCVAGWSAVSNFLAGAAYGPGGSGHFPNELVNDWLLNADIATLENLMEVMGIDYGYTWTPPQGYSASGRRGGTDLKSPESRAEMCQYWQSCYEPALTREEMKPDAIILPGISGSAAGTWYGVAGEELVLNARSGEVSVFGYAGQGSGVAVGADASIYVGLIWNLEQNRDYEGGTSALTVEYVPGIGGQAQLFWATGSIPFTGETWGISIGPSGGVSGSVAGIQTHYVCQLRCR